MENVCMANFYNQATLAYNGTTVNSNITTGEIVERITVTKTAVLDRYYADSEITYVMTIRNSGSTSISNLILTDNLGEYDYNELSLVPLEYIQGAILYYVNGVLQNTPTVTVGPPLTITGISIPAGGTVIIVYKVRTNQFAPLDQESSIENTVSVIGDGINTPITANETVYPQSEPILSITKALTPIVVEENSRITYTFTIENKGNVDVTAGDSVVLTDKFNPILSDITVTFNGTAWTEGVNYIYDATTGEFSTVAGQITVPSATTTRDDTTGAVSITPGVSTITVTGTI